MSKMEENKYEGRDGACLASSDLGMLRCVEDQPGLVVGSQWRVGRVMTSCACLCELVLQYTGRALHHEAVSAVYVQLMLTEALLPYCNLQVQPGAFNIVTQRC